MAGIRLNRNARNRWRTVAVWAMLPFVAFNSRTVVGCGCTGHFEAACHCNFGESSHSSCTKCDDKVSIPCPCCQKHDKCPTENPAKDSQTVDDKYGFHSNHCKGAVLHEVVPATVVSIHAADYLSLSALVLDAIDLPAAINQQTIALVASEHSSPPPFDLVVTLRRLVI